MYAFPNKTESFTEQTGMTLRDYFAGQALQGLIARSSTPFDIFAARYAYRIADIMLEARGE